MLFLNWSLKQEKRFHLITLAIFSKIDFVLSVFHEEQKKNMRGSRIAVPAGSRSVEEASLKGKCLWSRLQFSAHLEGRRPQCHFMK